MNEKREPIRNYSLTIRISTLSLKYITLIGGRCKKGFLYYQAGGSGSDCLGITRHYFTNGQSLNNANSACQNLEDSDAQDTGSHYCDETDGGFVKLLQVIDIYSKLTF